MSEPTNAPRVWLRWALASALVCGTVVGSIAPALGQEDPAEEAQPAAETPAPEASQFQDAVEAVLTAETTEPAVEEAPPEEAPPAEAQPAEGHNRQSTPPPEEPAADTPVQEAATDQTPYYDPVAGNANLDTSAAQEALGTTDSDAVPADGGGDDGSTGDGSGGGQGEPATTEGSSE